jgi:hypothetical protein
MCLPDCKDDFRLELESASVIVSTWGETERSGGIVANLGVLQVQKMLNCNGVGNGALMFDKILVLANLGSCGIRVLGLTLI